MLHSYNLKQCVVLVDGLPVKGFADGDAVTVEYESDIWSDAVGADGEVTRSFMGDQRATVTFHLKDTSALNPFFRAKVNAARNAGMGDVFSVMVKDLNLDEKLVSPQTYVKSDPGMTKAQESSNREWACMGSKVTIT